MKILAFAGSNSRHSINKQLVGHVARYFPDDAVEIVDLNDFEMPIYSIDREKADGVPSLALDFADKIDGSDLLILSLSEHNGAYTTAFKNVFDWVSRVPQRKPFGEKPMLLMATAPGPRGGAGVLDIAQKRFPFSGAVVLGTFSLPNFVANFEEGIGIVNPALKHELEAVLEQVRAHV